MVDNPKTPKDAAEKLEQNADARLRQFIERIERLNGEREDLNADIRGVYAEAKAVGFEPVIMRKVVAMRKQDPADRLEQESLLEVYKGACGL